jgi:hypothetical protein
MTQHELLLRLLLLARDVEENGLLFRTRARHQARFYERNPSARKWIVHGMLTYYREADLAEMQTVLESDTQLMEFYDRNRIELEMARPDIGVPNVLVRLGELRDLASTQCTLAVNTPFVNVMTYFRKQTNKE